MACPSLCLCPLIRGKVLKQHFFASLPRTTFFWNCNLLSSPSYLPLLQSFPERQIYLDKYGTSVLTWVEIISRHSRRGALYSANSLPSYPKPHRIISFREHRGGHLQPSNLPTCALRSELSPLDSHPSALFCTFLDPAKIQLFMRFHILRQRTAQRGIPLAIRHRDQNEPSQR